MTLRPPRRTEVLVVAAVALAVAAYAVWYYARPESPAAAYQNTQRAWLAGDHGAVWDRLDSGSQVVLDAAYPLVARQEAEKLDDPAEAHRLVNLRGKELFVELSRRGHSLEAPQWQRITAVEVDRDRAKLSVERPPSGDHPTSGTVGMTREGGVWKLSVRPP